MREIEGERKIREPLNQKCAEISCRFLTSNHFFELHLPQPLFFSWLLSKLAATLLWFLFGLRRDSELYCFRYWLLHRFPLRSHSDSGFHHKVFFSIHNFFRLYTPSYKHSKNVATLLYLRLRALEWALIWGLFYHNIRFFIAVVHLMLRLLSF